MTYYQIWQKEKFGDILPDTENEDIENDIENLRLAEFIETMNELQRLEDEN